jgi:hypothetical protein
MTTRDFRTAFFSSDDLVQRSISDFLYVHSGEVSSCSGIFIPRSNRIDFDDSVLPVLLLLCPSFRLESSGYNIEGNLQYHLAWDEGSLTVPVFIMEESDRQFDEFMTLFGIGKDDEAEEAEEPKPFDPYTMVPLNYF